MSTSLWIDVANTPPTVALAAPLPSFRYSVGDTIDIDLTATDTEDGTLTGASIFSEVRMIHLGHFHPVTEFSGATSSFLAEDHGSDDTYYQVISTATDAFGRSTTTTADILPEKRTVTVTSVPAGATISLDGVQRTTPYSWLSIVGGHHEMEAPADLLSGGLPYAFDQWVHGQKTGNEQYFTFDTNGTAPS